MTASGSDGMSRMAIRQRRVDQGAEAGRVFGRALMLVALCESPTFLLDDGDLKMVQEVNALLAQVATKERAIEADASGMVEEGVGDERWTSLAEQLHDLQRMVSWLRGSGVEIREKLRRGEWSKDYQEMLAGAINRLWDLALAFGYPSPDRKKRPWVKPVVTPLG